MNLFTPVRGAGVNDWQPFLLNAVNYADNAEYKQYYQSVSDFTASGTTTTLTSGSKIYPKLGKVNWSPEYDSANSSNLADSVRPLLFTNSAQNLNKVVTLKQENANTIDYQHEAPVVGTTTTLKFYTGSGTANYYNVVMPTLTANKKTKYNFSLVAGVYGTADTTNSQYDLGVATVTIVGSPSGDITRVDTTASASLTPIAM